MRSALLLAGTGVLKVFVAVFICVTVGFIDVASSSLEVEAFLGEIALVLAAIVLLEKGCAIAARWLLKQLAVRQEL